MFKQVLVGLVAMLVLLIYPISIQAQTSSSNDEDAIPNLLDLIVVSGTLDPQLLKQTTKSISVITKSDLDAEENLFLPNVLKQLPGVYFTNNGGMGQWTTVNIRGAGAKYTQYEFNGIPLTDVADTQAAFTGFIEDFYATDNVSQIEVLRGTSSTIHGSNAIGGVISVETDRWIDGIRANFRSEYGSYNTYVESARIAYGQPDRFYIDANITYSKTDGKVYTREYGTGSGLQYHETMANVSFGYKPIENASIEFVSIFSKANMMSVNSPSAKPGTPNGFSDIDSIIPQYVSNNDNHRESSFYQLGLIWRHKVNNFWDYSLTASMGATERHYFTVQAGGMDKGFYDGESLFFKMQHNIYPNDWLTINTGIQLRKLTYKDLMTPGSWAGNFNEVTQEISYDATEIFLQFQGKFFQEKFLTNIGGRFSKYSVFDSRFLFDVSAAYIFDTGTKIHAQYATGYRAPSPYELFGVYIGDGYRMDIGNPNLKPEESKSFEIGISQYLDNDNFVFDLTYFKIDVDDIIYYGATGYDQGNKGKVSGVEASLTYKPLDNLRFGFSYTYVTSEYKTFAGSEFLRTEGVPHALLNFNVLYKPIPKLTLSAGLNYRGSAPYTFYGGPLYQEKASTVINFAASYQINDYLKLFARVDNLNNAKYSVLGYIQPGASVYAGITLSYR
jgi:vitamin B12 transporter